VLQGTWRRVGARLALCLDLKLVCRGTRFAGYRQWPSGPHRERQRIHRWGQLFNAPLGYVEHFGWQLSLKVLSSAGTQKIVVPWEALLEVWERLSLSCRTSTAGHLGGGVRDPRAPTINVKNIFSGFPVRRCRRSESTHHQRKKHQRWTPGEAMSGIRKRPPST
jgi:hypothetical protein